MDIKKLKEQIKKDKIKEVEIMGYGFTIKTLNSLDMSKIFLKCQKEDTQAEIEMVLQSVIDYKNIKVKDLISANELLSKKEMEQDIEEFDREIFTEFLGLHQDVMTKLYEEISKVINDYLKKIELQKKT